jgi:hypothetical protein
MELIRSLWASKPPAPPLEGDKVYPSHLLDNSKFFDSFLITSTWFYNDVLDSDKLHHSLTRLLETGDWRKLGGRYRRPNGRILELHVPEAFTPERPAVAYSCEAFDVKFRDHPASDALPKSAEACFSHPQMKLGDLAHRPGGPRTMLDLLKGDHPSLALRIVTFEDATIVTLTWPHSMMDAQGLGSLVNAWSIALADSGVPVPPLAGASNDVLLKLSDSPKAYDEEYEYASQCLNGFGTFVFMMRIVLGMFWGPKKEDGLLHVSKEAAQSLRNEALKDIADRPALEGDRPWVSPHDVLASVWIKSVALSGSRPSPVTLRLPCDLRRRLHGSLDSGSLYVQNMVLAVCCAVSGAMAAGPLGEIAVAIRQTLQRQMAGPQILAGLRSKREDRDRKVESMGVPGPLNSTYLSITDWSKSGFFQTPDFSAAVIKQGQGADGRDNPVGSPYHFHADAVHNSSSMSGLVNTVVHLGKDQKGGHWFMATLPPRAWKLAREIVGKHSN